LEHVGQGDEKTYEESAAEGKDNLEKAGKKKVDTWISDRGQHQTVNSDKKKKMSARSDAWEKGENLRSGSWR